VSQPALDVIAFAAVVVVVLVDRRWAVVLASSAAALGLAPDAAAFGGGWAALAMLGAAALAGVGGWVGGRAGSWLHQRVGPDPRHSLVRLPEALFGPRSVRIAAAAVAVPAASWVSFNVPVGSVTVVEGRLFPIAVMFAAGAVRLLLARSVSDLGVGVAAAALATSAGWLLRGGGDPLPAAIGIAALAPVAAAFEGWLEGRRQGTAVEARG